MNTYNQIQDVVDAIERELFIEVRNGFGVEVAPNTFDIGFREKLSRADLEAVEEIAYEYAPSARSVYVSEGGGQFTSGITIRF